MSENYRRVGFEWSVSNGRLWHTGCGKEVLYIEGDYVCECGESSGTESELETFIANVSPVGLVVAMVMNPEKMIEIIDAVGEMIKKGLEEQ